MDGLGWPSPDRNEMKGKVMMRPLLVRALTEESGQDLIEYALLAAFISLVATAAITSIGSQVNTWYEGYGTTIKTVPTGAAS